jgi:hypothetical protein
MLRLLNGLVQYAGAFQREETMMADRAYPGLSGTRRNMPNC